MDYSVMRLEPGQQAVKIGEDAYRVRLHMTGVELTGNAIDNLAKRRLVRGECGHPRKEDGDALNAFHRFLSIDESNVSHTLTDFIEARTEDGSVEVFATCKPAGPNAALTKALLEKYGRSDRRLFGLRGIVAEAIVAGVEVKILRNVVTWDLVNLPPVPPKKKVRLIRELWMRQGELKESSYPIKEITEKGMIICKSCVSLFEGTKRARLGQFNQLGYDTAGKNLGYITLVSDEDDYEQRKKEFLARYARVEKRKKRDAVRRLVEFLRHCNQWPVLLDVKLGAKARLSKSAYPEETRVLQAILSCKCVSEVRSVCQTELANIEMQDE